MVVSFSYIGHVILATLITVFTLGICAPWGMCILYNWKINIQLLMGIAFTLTVLPCSFLEIGLSGGS